jgi:hypothetical protein
MTTPQNRLHAIGQAALHVLYLVIGGLAAATIVAAGATISAAVALDVLVIR